MMMNEKQDGGFEFRPVSDAELIKAVDEWLRFRQPFVGTKEQADKNDAMDREYRFRLANKAAEWAYTRRADALIAAGRRQ
jgi:hypothetical protein